MLVYLCAFEKSFLENLVSWTNHVTLEKGEVKVGTVSMMHQRLEYWSTLEGPKIYETTVVHYTDGGISAPTTTEGHVPPGQGTRLK